MKNRSLSLFTFLLFFATATTNIYSRENAIIVGASSGIGRAVAKKLSEKYDIGIVARRTTLLNTLKQEILDSCKDNENQPQVFVKTMDVTQNEQMQQNMAELIEEMGGTLDLIVISVTAYSKNGTTERDTLNVDLMGFYNVASFIVEIFKQQKSGHLVGMSSVDALKGNALCPVYSGTKAFISTYLEGERNYMIQNNIPVNITDVLPGWVDKEDVKFSEMPGTYWVIDTKKAADLICKAIEKKEKEAFIPGRWKLMDIVWNVLPDSVYNAAWWPWR